MFIVEVAPLKATLRHDSLSYFTSKALDPGSLVRVPLRGKVRHAVVLACSSVSQKKAEIKSASFVMRKVLSLSSGPFLSKDFMTGVKNAADYFATSPGSILFQLLPALITENPKLLKIVEEEKEVVVEEASTKSRLEAIQTEYEERYMHYKAAIREEFAKKKSVFLCLPQNEDVRKAKDKLERGIEAYVASFHSGLSEKEMTAEWQKVCKTEHPVLIIATPAWFFMPRRDIGMYIIDQENKSGWKTLKRPFIDYRTCIELVAREQNIRTIIGDSILRVETLTRYKQTEIEEFESVKWRLPPLVETEVISMTKDANKEKEFHALSETLISHLKETSLTGNHAFVYAARKGLSASTICRDCGTVVSCNNCNAPMVLYKKKESNIFRCHQCGEVRDAAEICRKCGGWKLAAFGTGIEKVKEELEAHFDPKLIFEINREATPTARKAQEVAEQFYATKGSILVGTEMALSFLHKKVDTSAIAAFDSLFSVPDFRIREKIFRLVIEVRSVAKEHFFLQSRNIEDEALNMARSGNLIEFYKMESDDRRALQYPPFSIFIKVTVRGGKPQVSKSAQELKNIFALWSPAIFPSLHEKRGEAAALNAVIKIPRENWPDPRLLESLRNLSPQYEIKVDPDNLL
jgi:primosomal protein N'